MESDSSPNGSRSSDWKIRFKKILTPHQNPSNNEGGEEAPRLLNSFNEENTVQPLSDPSCIVEESDKNQEVEKPEFHRVGSLTFRGDPKESENILSVVNSSILAKSAHIDANSQSYLDSFASFPTAKLPDESLNDFEDRFEEEKDIVNIITADAEELAKKLSSLGVKKKNKYCNMAQSNGKEPKWNIDIKKALDPTFQPESLSTTPKESDSLCPELAASGDILQYAFHKLSRDDDQPLEEVKKVRSKSKKKRIYTEEEKKVLEIFQSARTFKLPEKPHVNVFDGAGIDCFKEREIKSTEKYSSKNHEKPKREPPPGGYVCVKPLTAEEISQRPLNLIISECWDYDDDEW